MADAPVNRILYLHGFASGPSSKKACWFRDRFVEAGRALEVLDLAQGDFDHLTITGQLRMIERAVRDEAVWLIGSSLGGYLAALYASQHPEAERLVLMAPAFNFVDGWRGWLGAEAMMRWKQSGQIAVQHYGDGLVHQLHYGLIEDASEYDAYPSFHQQSIIFHGRNDDVVPPEHSITFAQRHGNVELCLMNSGHELTDVLEEMWREIARFCGLAEA